jgi:predicted oxidoreductase (fatty acid repression mutant protein)
MGATIQHYGGMSKDVEAGIIKAFDLPTHWRSTGLMPFGVPAGPPKERTYAPIEDRVKVITQ